VLTFLLEGLLFILIGLQLPIVLAAITGYSVAQRLEYAVIASLTVIAVRLVWIFVTAYLSSVVSRLLHHPEAPPCMVGGTDRLLGGHA
jgi:monovalent cation/hydrogen antiporter